MAIAHEAGVDFKMEDIDRLSRNIPVLCKVAPNGHYHVQDVNRAGGIMGIMGELAKNGLIDTTTKRIDSPSLADTLQKYYYGSEDFSEEARNIYLSAPANRYNRVLGSQATYYKQMDEDHAEGCIRDMDHAYFRDGGLAVLFGNIARKGCIVKTAGVSAELMQFSGKARVYESQEQAMNGILSGEVVKGDVVVIRYEGPKGGPGMQEMLYPTSYLKSKHLDKDCALITDGRFSGGTSGLSIGHVSPEAASGGEIGIIEDGDMIDIDITARSINLRISNEELQRRMEAWKIHRPKLRERVIPQSLKAYSLLVSSADQGAVRIVPEEL